MLWPMHFPDTDWLVPDWPAPPTVRAVCTTRNAGVSQGPFSSMNLGLHVGDSVERVLQNRQLLAARLGAQPVVLDLVHKTDILTLQPDSPDGSRADGVVTQASGVACTIMVADCLPILLCNTSGTQVAAVHAGWRGLVGQGGQGVIESVVHAMEPSPMLAWLGPCIGPKAFEVGDEVRAAFVADCAAARAAFHPLGGGKWLADLPMLARQRLSALGVDRVYGNDGSAAWCTVSNPSKFFSHRRDAGVSGRQAACIWRVD